MDDINMKPERKVCGVGTNDADYAIAKFEPISYVNGKRKQKRVWICAYYKTWKAMLNRCYSAKLHEISPTYKNCTVATEWLTFTNFKTWMETKDWEGKQLDKDLLVKGNKIYSPETCVFVTKIVNGFTTERGADRGKWQIGASWHKTKEKFKASCRNPFTKKNENLGYFDCEQAAHQAWRKRKLELAHELAAIQTDPRVAKALIDRYSKPRH